VSYQQHHHSKKKKKQNREQKKGNKQRRGRRTVDRPESAPQAATTSTSMKPLQRDKNTIYRGERKNRGKR
jgi:hypothetical protein